LDVKLPRDLLPLCQFMGAGIIRHDGAGRPLKSGLELALFGELNRLGEGFSCRLSHGPVMIFDEAQLGIHP
jgi:hypothetical protein